MEPLAPGYDPPKAIDQRDVIMMQPAVQEEEPKSYGPLCTSMVCKNCRTKIYTQTEYTVGSCTWLFAILICLVCPLGCALIPFFSDYFKDVTHSCPLCATIQGKWERW